VYKLTNTNNTDPSLVKESLLKEGYDSVYKWEDLPGTFYDWHTHNNYEVRWVYDGEVIIGVKVNNQVIELNLKPGDKLEIIPNTLHFAKTQSGVKYICASK